MAYDDWTQAQKDALDAELRTDPKGWGYAVDADSTIADKLNTVIEDDQDSRFTVGRRQTMTVGFLLNLIDSADFAKLNNTAKQSWWTAATAGEALDVSTDQSFVVRVIDFIFDDGSPTDVAFTSALVIPVSRATSIGIPAPDSDDINIWRRLTGGF